jgi:large subunit ribosomal protein L16
MILQPRKTKFKKVFKGKIKGKAKNGYEISFGRFGLKAMESHRLKSKQIEAARKTINGYLKRKGKLWIRVFPNTPVTKKPVEVRMGGGKGNVEFWVCKTKIGKILFELDNVEKRDAMMAFDRASDKLPIVTKFIEKEE